MMWVYHPCGAYRSFNESLRCSAREFPGDPVVGLSYFHCGGPRFSPLVGELRSLIAEWHGQKGGDSDSEMCTVDLAADITK